MTISNVFGWLWFLDVSWTFQSGLGGFMQGLCLPHPTLISWGCSEVHKEGSPDDQAVNQQTRRREMW